MQEKPAIKAIIEIWNEAVERNQSLMPKVMSITANTSRYNYVRARWKEHPDLDLWRTMATMATQSDFLNGRTKNRDRPMSFDWIVQSTGNLTKVIEGKYRNIDYGGLWDGNFGGRSSTGGRRKSKYDDLEVEVLHG